MIVLYTLGCPACKVLEAKLDAKGVKYEKNESEDDIRSLGFTTVPLLRVDEKIYTFAEAIQYVNSLG